MTTAIEDEDAQRVASEKSSAALLSVFAACAMTGLKVVTGVLTGSLGMLSDAAHSGIDLLGAGLTFFSVRVSGKPADEDHTYGHGKIENLSAFAETGLMVISCFWITYEAIDRIFFHPTEVKLSLWPFAVLLTSIAVDYWRSRQLLQVARRHGSAALEADALHFASDIWATLAVLLGLAATWIGAQFHLRWLHYADPLAAIAVSILIFRFTWNLATKTIAVLLDSAPAETRQRMMEEVGRTDGVLSVDQARVRRSGTSYFADLTLSLSRHLTFQHTEDLVHEATEAVRRVIPGADVVIHTVPRETVAESVFDKVRAVASRNNVVLHDVSVQSIDGQLHVEQHIEVNETMPLRKAHDFVRHVEDEIRTEVPQIASVLTHIESEPSTIELPVSIERDRQIESRLRSAARRFPEVLDIHEIVIGRVGDRIHVSCHCTLPDALEMQHVHDVITGLEDQFKQEAPDVYRVLIHPEPVSDNHHH
ncbi:Cobalt-zinc-cadmium resistance protein [Acidisarcina polymorpha]|uniref:Cobalt-zinc-cadmium resistance protein n=1 Tax=Acidisarcina polymorpha TaxID=2211140 RepID=A0A2Z5FX91_9BACT|nr:cation-efflux pump [Acidisarcina polymorpha]AXC11503.1 Cobalt-zinc-cadmium resistance protein [Acidisarcina polymorpha]